MKLPRRIDLLNAIAPRHGVTVTRDVGYGPGPQHRLDIYRPAQRTGRLPVILFFYGGSWQSGRRADYRFAGAALARLGLVVAIADYRLYPEARYPDFLHDAAAATAWALDHIGDHGGDPDALFLAGHSAGAYIAMMLALAGEYLAVAASDRAFLAGAIGIAGPYDFLPITGPTYRKIFGGAQDLAMTQPASFADHAAPPILLVTGARDRVVAPANSAVLAAKLRAAGARVDTRIYPSVGHIRILLALLPPLSLTIPVLDDIASFVAGTLQARLHAEPATRRADMAGRGNPG